MYVRLWNPSSCVRPWPGRVLPASRGDCVALAPVASWPFPCFVCLQLWQTPGHGGHPVRNAEWLGGINLHHDNPNQMKRTACGSGSEENWMIQKHLRSRNQERGSPSRNRKATQERGASKPDGTLLRQVSRDRGTDSQHSC